MIQISQISFRNIILKDIIFSDGEDLMQLLKKIGKESIEIQDEELETWFEERQDDEEKNEITIEDIKKNSMNQIYLKLKKNKYLGAVTRTCGLFQYEINDLFENHTDAIISQINEKYSNLNTRRQYVSSLLNI